MDRTYLVQRRSRREVEEMASDVRAALGLAPDQRASMLGIFESILPQLIDGFHIRVVEDRVLRGAEAVTDLEKPVITFAQSTYDKLYRGGARQRMTAAHELGHLLLHTQRPRWAAFSGVRDPLADSERQADIFGEAFLMPAEAFRKVSSIEEAMHKFGVSRDAATYRARRLKLNYLINPPRAWFLKRKGRRSMTHAP